MAVLLGTLLHTSITLVFDYTSQNTFDKSKHFGTYASAFFSAVTKTDKTTEEGTCIGAETFAFIIGAETFAFITKSIWLV